MNGSGAILEEAEAYQDVITDSHMANHNNSIAVKALAKESFALLVAETVEGSKARSYVKVLKPHQGLEAWRSMRKGLSMRDGQRVNEEFGRLTKLR